jgi:homoaconitase/3-isopropylmalate dehydratase large subunit
MKVPRTLLFKVSGKLGAGVMGKDLALHIMKLLGPDGANYRAIEYTGDAVKALSLDGRMSVCNMAVEAGAKNGVIEADEKVEAFLKGRTDQKYDIVKSDADAVYEKVFEIDGDALPPTVSLPGSSSNSAPVGEAVGTPFTRALLGTCTNGRMEDFRVAAAILKGRKVHPKVRLQAIPASRGIFRQCIDEGLVQIFLDAGAIWCNPNCGPCAGGHYGLLGKDEVCVSTSNRNMPGRMGDSSAKIFLASPAVVAASAVNGKITDPRDYL